MSTGAAGIPNHRDCQAQRTCRERFCTATKTVSGVWCIENVKQYLTNIESQLKLGDDDVSVGISMPPTNSGLSEFMLNASVPIPYGSVSITMGDNTSSPYVHVFTATERPSSCQSYPSFVMAEFFVFQTVVDTPMNTSNVRSQIGTRRYSVFLIFT